MTWHGGSQLTFGWMHDTCCTLLCRYLERFYKASPHVWRSCQILAAPGIPRFDHTGITCAIGHRPQCPGNSMSFLVS